MKNILVRWIQTLGCTAFLGTIVATSTGCGALAAAANPKVAWALKDPAPMSVVVRRADVAEKTAHQIERVMTDTPANDDSPWLQNVAPSKKDAAQAFGELRENTLYASGTRGDGPRIVAAEVWAKSLASLEPKASKNTHAPAAAPAVAAVDANASETRGNPGSLTATDTKDDKKASKTAAEDKQAAEPVAAPEAAVAPTVAKYTSLLAAIGKDLGIACAEIIEKRKAIGELKAQIAVEEKAADEKGVSDSDKAAHKKTIEGLEHQVDKSEEEAEKLTDAFVPKARAAAGKAPADVRERFGAVLVTLRHAVEDAKISNSAAAVRYVLAAPTLLDSAAQMASIYVADIIEEETGKRPATTGIKPGVTLEGGRVAITLNDLSQSDLGKLSVGALVSKVAARTTKWVFHAMGLLGTISGTRDVLSFENDVINAILDGFAAAGWKAPGEATIEEL